MLDQLLKLTAQGGIRSLQDLAQAFDVSEALVQVMLQDLERMGYLQRINAVCAGRCEHCEASAGCTFSAGGQIWSLTQSGLRQAQKTDHES